MRKITANATHAVATLAVTAAAVLAAFALPLPAQAVTINLFSGDSNTVKGSGKEVGVARQVGAFTALRLDSSIDVHARQGAAPSVTVHADDNIEPLVETAVDGDTLVVRLKKGTSFRTSHKVLVDVVFTSLTAVQQRGSGDLHIDRISGPKFESATDAKLQTLARQVVRFQEDERAHLARELHDGATQTMVSAKLLVESAIVELEREARPAPRALEKALAGLKQSLSEVRRISHRLRPAMLDELGLPAALELLMREAEDAGATPVDLRVVGEAVSLPDEVKTALFRVSQEALANVAKHARASRVEMTLSFAPDGVALRIGDDGRGFEVDRVQLDPDRGIGLRNMRERLASIGGTFEVLATPGAGTLLLAKVPSDAIRRLGGRGGA